MIEKYNDLAREASSNGDKILSENYLQHADHFTRVLSERENIRREKISDNKAENNTDNTEEVLNSIEGSTNKEITNVPKSKTEEKEITKT